MCYIVFNSHTVAEEKYLLFLCVQSVVTGKMKNQSGVELDTPESSPSHGENSAYLERDRPEVESEIRHRTDHNRCGEFESPKVIDGTKI